MPCPASNSEPSATFSLEIIVFSIGVAGALFGFAILAVFAGLFLLISTVIVVFVVVAAAPAILLIVLEFAATAGYIFVEIAGTVLLLWELVRRNRILLFFPF